MTFIKKLDSEEDTRARAKLPDTLETSWIRRELGVLDSQNLEFTKSFQFFPKFLTKKVVKIAITIRIFEQKNCGEKITNIKFL